MKDDVCGWTWLAKTLLNVSSRLLCLQLLRLGRAAGGYDARLADIWSSGILLHVRPAFPSQVLTLFSRLRHSCKLQMTMQGYALAQSALKAKLGFYSCSYAWGEFRVWVLRLMVMSPSKMPCHKIVDLQISSIWFWKILILSCKQMQCMQEMLHGYNISSETELNTQGVKLSDTAEDLLSRLLKEDANERIDLEGIKVAFSQ